MKFINILIIFGLISLLLFSGCSTYDRDFRTGKLDFYKDSEIISTTYGEYHIDTNLNDMICMKSYADKLTISFIPIDDFENDLEIWIVQKTIICEDW